MISNERLEEFKQLYRDAFKEEISDKVALEMAVQLVEMFRVICRPLPANHKCRFCRPEKNR